MVTSVSVITNDTQVSRSGTPGQHTIQDGKEERSVSNGAHLSVRSGMRQQDC